MEISPSYVKLLQNGELEIRAENAFRILTKCISCPSHCEVDRTRGVLGFCNSGHMPIVSSYCAHFGEEPVLSGIHGSGNIFFGNCNLKCVFCQNYEISQNPEAEKIHEVSHEKLAEIMLSLQSKGCHNIGLVSPSHFSATILKSIYIAAKNGLKIPLIYNTNGYDSVDMLRHYEDVIDIYLPDFKYGDDEYALKYSRAKHYYAFAKEAIKEMYRQVGDELIFDGDLLVRGLIIRHLVLPNGLAESERVFKFIAEELSPKVHISLMSQYYPTNKAYNEILLNRPLRYSEYENAKELMQKYGLENGWFQEMESPDNYRPHFNEDRDNPFKN